MNPRRRRHSRMRRKVLVVHVAWIPGKPLKNITTAIGFAL